jgi:hypothetical protein
LKERKRERMLGVVMDTTMVVFKETIFSVLKVPRQCPLVRLVGVRLVFRINPEF